MFEESLFIPMESSIEKESSESKIFIDFLNLLEGWKTKCKNLHWAAPNKNIHEYLDDFLEVLSDYQDGLAEGYMGILGKMSPNVIKGTDSETLNAIDFIEEVKEGTLSFYNRIPQETIYKGIASECETLIQNINKYRYLFSLCGIELY
jgi:DNA-binding ferritin-like protein